MREISKPHPNAKEYWPLRKGAFRALTRLHDLKGREERAPRYLAGGYDDEGNAAAITEQLGPAEDFDQTLRSALGSNPFVRETLALLWQFFRFHRYRLRFAFPIRNSYPTDIPRKVPLNCQSSAIRPTTWRPIRRLSSSRCAASWRFPRLCSSPRSRW